MARLLSMIGMKRTRQLLEKSKVTLRQFINRNPPAPKGEQTAPAALCRVKRFL
jgi:hypothetical protein